MYSSKKTAPTFLQESVEKRAPEGTHEVDTAAHRSTLPTPIDDGSTPEGGSSPKSSGEWSLLSLFGLFRKNSKSGRAREQRSPNEPPETSDLSERKGFLRSLFRFKSRGGESRNEGKRRPLTNFFRTLRQRFENGRENQDSTSSYCSGNLTSILSKRGRDNGSTNKEKGQKRKPVKRVRLNDVATVHIIPAYEKPELRASPLRRSVTINTAGMAFTQKSCAVSDDEKPEPNAEDHSALEEKSGNSGPIDPLDSETVDDNVHERDLFELVNDDVDGNIEELNESDAGNFNLHSPSVDETTDRHKPNGNFQTLAPNTPELSMKRPPSPFELDTISRHVYRHMLPCEETRPIIPVGRVFGAVKLINSSCSAKSRYSSEMWV